MPFEPTELQLEILRIVAVLQDGTGRVDVHFGDPVVFREGVPEGIIVAEMFGRRPPDETLHGRVAGAIKVLDTRRHLRVTCTKHEQWRNLRYRRPDRRLITTRIRPGTEYREVLLDEQPICHEVTFGFEPTEDFACCHITAKGLDLLDLASLDEAATTSTDRVTGDGWSATQYTLDTIPPLVTADGSWVRQKRLSDDEDDAITLSGRALGTLSNDRSAGRKPEDGSGTRGIDRRERVWRKEGKNSQTVWYLRSTLRHD